MQTIRSGKEVCDEFFEALPAADAVDPSIAELLHELHETGKLTKDTILEGLEALRQDGEEDREG